MIATDYDSRNADKFVVRLPDNGPFYGRTEDLLAQLAMIAGESRA